MSFSAWQRLFEGMSVPSHSGRNWIKGEATEDKRKLISENKISLWILYVRKKGQYICLEIFISLLASSLFPSATIMSLPALSCQVPKEGLTVLIPCACR